MIEKLGNVWLMTNVGYRFEFDKSILEFLRFLDAVLNFLAVFNVKRISEERLLSSQKFLVSCPTYLHGFISTK